MRKCPRWSCVRHFSNEKTEEGKGKTRTLKPATRVAYEHSLKKFAEWLGVEGAKGVVVALCAMKSGEANLTLLRYTNSLPATLSPSAVNQRMQGIRSMVKLARMVGFITWEILIPCRRVEHFGIRGDPVKRLW